MRKLSITSVLMTFLLLNLVYADSQNSLNKSINIQINQPIQQARGNFPYTLDRKDKLLQLCLNYNYAKLGVYKVTDLKDFSTLRENKGFEGSSNPNNDLNMLNFIEKNANFYTDNYPMHSEVIAPPYNAVFARCMDLYKSKKLEEFVNSLQPPISASSK